MLNAFKWHLVEIHIQKQMLNKRSTARNVTISGFVYTKETTLLTNVSCTYQSGIACLFFSSFGIQVHFFLFFLLIDVCCFSNAALNPFPFCSWKYNDLPKICFIWNEILMYNILFFQIMCCAERRKNTKVTRYQKIQ